MNKDTKIALLLGGIFVLIVIVVIISISINNKNITANTIADLEKKLDEQGELTAEQEAKLEELAKVTCKEVQVPYDAQEAYTEQEPYTEEVCDNLNLIYKKDTGSCMQYDDNFFSEDEPAKYDCTITNLDNQAGTFFMEIGFYMDGQKIVETQNKYIYPQSSGTFYTEKMAYIDSCYCSVTSIPTKQECEMVTKYKTVTKYRTVTKYKTETICE